MDWGRVCGERYPTTQALEVRMLCWMVLRRLCAGMIVVFGVVLWMGCETPIPPVIGEFSVLTYNVKGLPAIIEGTEDPATRMKLISPMLNDYDIVGVQENFQYNDELMSKVTLASRVHASREPRDRAYGSGLSLLSRFVAVAQEDAAWETCHGVVSNANDCLAYKGFQRVRFALQQEPSIVLDVYNLHADAGSGEGDQAARMAQVEQLLSAIQKQSAGQAVLVIGDSNMRALRARDSGKTDADQLTRLMEGAGLTESCKLFSCDSAEKEHIDRVFFRRSPALQLEALSWKTEARFVNEKGAALSDHPAVLVRFRYTYTAISAK